MSTIQFLQDRARGKVGQRLLVDVLSAWGLDPYEVPDGMFPDFDIKINTGKTIEVKTDYKSHLTGNIVLELDALDHSKADILAMCYGNPIQAIYLVPLDKARAFAHSWPNKIRAGEFNGEMALVKRTLFIELLNPQVIDLKENQNSAR